jgi:hypothetical protein
MNGNSSGLRTEFDPVALENLISEVVERTILRLEGARATAGERLAYNEQEAAALLGLNWYQLRDERLRGRIASTKVVGDRIRYLREDLIAYLMRSRRDCVAIMSPGPLPGDN